MNNIKILDCTLRDGGRIIDCNFPNHDIVDISSSLADAKIDIVEVGFLRDWRNTEYKGNSTFFTSVDQIKPFVKNRKHGTMYVAFIDFGMFDFDSLAPYDGTSIEGIRVGFTKKDFISKKNEIIKCLEIVKAKGYKLFVQGVNSLGYSDSELLQIVDMVNDIHPYGFGIVDTYGAMYIEDVRRIYSLVDNNLLDDISIDFHSHNNFQLSFSLAQEIIALSRGIRKIVLDATLNGMGKCAGNLNTELIVDYMVRKLHYNYDWDMLLDIIDEHMYAIKEKSSWGYSIPAMMAGVYKSHPNNVIYLTEKFRLATKDIKYIISMIEPDLRQTYDYENIKQLYKTYNHTKVDDSNALELLHGILNNRKILLMFPGSSIREYENEIQKYIEENDAFVISVNFIADKVNEKNRIAFFGSEKRYKRAESITKEANIVVSNIRCSKENDIIINYESVINRESEDFDNTAIMLLNLLYRLNITKVAIAGLDGYRSDSNNYFSNEMFDVKRFEDKFERINNNMKIMLKNYALKLGNKTDVVFITPSLYEEVFREV